ncbi:MAG: hypothetical protein H6606_07425 [Flavobacteriales bacterium]|nr:hypothetical protein [Flavobacteriales bacterium]
MKKCLTLFTLALVFSTASAQSNFECGFDSAVNLMNAQDTNWYNYQDMYQQQIQEQLDELEVPEPMGQGGVLNKTEPDVQARFLIPVVVHILHLEADSLPGMQSNITDAQVAHQLEILNRAFRNASEADTNAVNTGIQFCLATRNIHGDSTSGIVRRAGDNLAYFKMMTGIPTPVDTLFPEDKYMNIYIVYRIISPGADTTGIKGLGLFPLQYMGNGVIMVYDWFGDETTCGDCLLNENSNGHVMVHEAGHYLGLYHTFQGGCSDSSAATCSGAGDRCCDTPPVAAANRSCTPEVNSCSEENDRPDMLSNYMDYSLQCGSAFTANQAALMHATLLSYRTALIEASNVARAGALGCDYHTALFSASQNLVCDSAWVKFTALDAGRSYHWTILNDNGDTLYYAAGDDTLLYNFNLPGAYDVQLITHTGGDSMAMYRSNLVQVADCGTPLMSTQGNWYFGYYAGLRFTNGGTFRDLSAHGDNAQDRLTLNSWEGTITRSDAKGELLFYGGSGLPGNSAFRLYNRLHDTLKGAPLPSYDNGSSVQAGLVIPHPQDTNKYYVFVNEEEDIDSSEGGLHYSIVDMTGDGGLGEVLSAWKDIPVKGNPARPHSADSAAHTAEGMTAIPACNGVDHWLITTDFDQYYLNVFLVHDDTLEWNATYQVPYYTKFRSTLVASPDGSKLACRGGILNFDRATGKITTFANAPQQTHQHCFSPNSQVLYLIVGSVLQQVNLLNNSLQARTVAQTPFGLGFGLQLGPDNKIYIVNDHLDFVSVVNFPNSLISDSDPNACGFQPVGVDLSAMGNEPYGQVGVPNIITAKKVEELPLDFYYVASNCSTVKFTTPIACAASYKWFFDDGDSSLSQNPTHSYSSPDRYNVSLIVDGDTVTKEIKLEINKPDITGNLEVCDTTEIQFYTLFNSDPADDYTWSVVEGGELIQSSQTEAQVLWGGDGIIRLDITGDNGCTGHVKDTVIALPVLDSNTISAGQTFYCGNSNPVITGSMPTGGNGSYT